ncbi:hypothetical protein [Patulibacter minatonensis]|uniref:hypothetical protein n=1 Tax=Patulibacter minatonensis TaxID=298163 RepID=UPI000479743E|nr:hypothetical protein [Patulibacter minatonensis]
MTLAERLIAIHRALDAAEVPHAFGGAIAYWTLDPRGTSDIDVNIFVPAEDNGPALSALPDGIDLPDGASATIADDGQMRLWWDGTPVDVFFDYAPVHAEAGRYRRIVPFAGGETPVLGPEELVVFKVVGDRTKDWADIEAVVAAGTVDLSIVRTLLHEMVGDDDPRLDRLVEAERRGRG